jgi:L-asparaginase/Glu-tRNA(Gln) amidotransferase subunit D
LQANYEKYDGFVVLHGTDTMAYTASALSFMCEHLGKPIILTGAQVRCEIQSSAYGWDLVEQLKQRVSMLKVAPAIK